VEASEAIRRIFWRHRWLLLILVIVPAVAVVTMREHQQVTYAATSTVQGQGTTPDAQTQVTAIQSRVTAVATDPAVVQQAITAAGVSANATQVAQHDIAVTPLGTSAVMVLTITDRSRPVALRLATSLAYAVVNQLNQLGIKGNPELSALNKSIAQLTSKRDKLVAELDSATASGVSSTSVQAQSLLAQLSATEQELATEESTSQQILSTLSANTGASIVSTPSSAAEASRHAITYGALAAVLGLVIGLLFGAVREIIRPTVAQPATGARELGAVPLGDAKVNGAQVTRLDADLAGRLGLTAHRAGVRTIVLTGPASRMHLSALADRLNSELAAAAEPRWPGGHDAWLRPPVPVHASGPAQNSGLGPGQSAEAGQNGDARYLGEDARYLGETANDGMAAARPGHPVGIGDKWPQPVVVALPDIDLGARQSDPALVAVLPEFAPHSSLDRTADLSVAADWPILGVIGLRGRRRFAAGRQAPRDWPHEGSGGRGGSSNESETERIDG
jgi:hypothetical protein